MSFVSAYDEHELLEAIGVWRTPFRADPEKVHRALSIVRFWRTELKADLRGLHRSTEEYKRIKKREEQLENMTLDLHSALLVQMNARRNGG